MEFRRGIFLLNGIQSEKSDNDRLIEYVEQSQSIATSTAGAWVTRTLTGIGTNQIVEISIVLTINQNRTVGVRQQGSAINRNFQTRTRNASFILTQTDQNERIQIFSNGTGVEFFVTGILR